MKNQPAARDTSFDNIIPKKIWLTYNNQGTLDRFKISLEINGIEKVIEDFYIPGLDQSEGHVCGSHNLSWLVGAILKTEPPPQASVTENPTKHYNSPKDVTDRRVSGEELEKVSWRHFNKINDRRLRTAVKLGYRACEDRLLNNTPAGMHINGDDRDDE